MREHKVLNKPLHAKVRDSRCPSFTTYHKAVLYAIASRIGPDKPEAYPNGPTLAADAGMSAATLWKVLKDLITWKVVIKRTVRFKDKNTRRNFYSIDVEMLLCREPFKVIRKKRPAPPQGWGYDH